MNRSLLLVVCDFLLLSILALARFDVPKDAVIAQDDQKVVSKEVVERISDGENYDDVVAELEATNETLLENLSSDKDALVEQKLKLEAEIANIEEAERAEFLALVGLTESSLDKLIRKSYEMLGLISYFSYNDEEVRAWTIHKGWKAPQAAGVIHTDFERGFIRAEVIPYETFARYGSRTEARSAGAMRVEGKEYIVSDGDVINFRFNV